MLDLLNTGYAACQENVEVYPYHHKHYINGVFYDKNKETYSEAYDRASKEMWDKIKKDNPHLKINNEGVDYSNQVNGKYGNTDYEDLKKVPIVKWFEPTGDTSKPYSQGGIIYPPKNKNTEPIPVQFEPPTPKKSIEQQIEEMKKDMLSYSLGAKVFKSVYEKQVKDNPELQKIFDEKLKQLQQ